MNEIKISPAALHPDPSAARFRSGGENSPPEPGRNSGRNDPGRKEPDHFFIRIKGQDLWAKSHVPLPAGGKISLTVEAVAPQVLLRLLAAAEEGEAASLGQLKKILGESVPLGSLAEKISALGKTSLDSFPAEVQKGMQELKAALAQYAPPFLTDPRTLREKISQSGLFWENRLQELIQEKGRRRLSSGQPAGSERAPPQAEISSSRRLPLLKEETDLVLAQGGRRASGPGPVPSKNRGVSASEPAIWRFFRKMAPSSAPLVRRGAAVSGNERGIFPGRRRLLLEGGDLPPFLADPAGDGKNQDRSGDSKRRPLLPISSCGPVFPGGNSEELAGAREPSEDSGISPFLFRFPEAAWKRRKKRS